MTVDGNHITADKGKLLSNGVDTGKDIYLSTADSAENWTEIDDPNYFEIPEETTEGI